MLKPARPRNEPERLVLGPLPENPQMSARVYRALLDSILTGQIPSGTPLRPDVIARQLDVSTTPVREAMPRLEADGVAVKLPYQGWYVREFSPEQIHDLYECRAEMESFAVSLACERITATEIEWLRAHQEVGGTALAQNDREAYRLYNRDLHAAILRAARNTYLLSMMSQLQLQSEMLTARTIRIEGRPPRAYDEHARLIDLIAARNAPSAAELLRHHIMSAYEDYMRAAAAESPS